MVTHTSCLLGQMDVISHSTLQVFFPAQLVARSSQNLHSFLNFSLEDSGEGEQMNQMLKMNLGAEQ